MLIIWLGALLILGGVLFMAEQTLLGGRLSGRFRRTPVEVGTLEPRERGGGFGLRTQWPGFAMIAVGAVLLLAGTAF